MKAHPAQSRAADLNCLAGELCRACHGDDISALSPNHIRRFSGEQQIACTLEFQDRAIHDPEVKVGRNQRVHVGVTSIRGVACICTSSNYMHTMGIVVPISGNSVVS